MKIKIILLCSFTIAFSQIALYAQIPTNGLVAFYPFNGNANDESGNGNNGIVFGATLADDRCSNPDSTYNFDGIDNYILINNSASLNSSESISLCAWILPVSFRGSGNSSIISKGYYSHIEPYYQYHLGITGDSYPNLPSSFAMSLSINNNSQVLTGPNSWVPNNWYFVVGTYDGNTMKLYVNSELIAEQAITGPIDVYNEPVCIGRTKNFIGGSYTPGSIDDARIYNRALSLEEIQGLYYTNCLLGQINGPLEVCQNQNNANYFVNSVSNADSYSWNFSGSGATIVGNSNNITIDFSDNATSGDLSVTVTGIDFNTQTASIPVTINQIPSSAGIITGTNEVCIDQNAVQYAVPLIANASSYSWNYSGTGATIIGTSKDIAVNFSQNATSGQLTVFGKNSCGNGDPSSEFPISINLPPSDAGLINGPNEVCLNQSGTPYSIPIINNATSYFWNYSGTGVTILGNSDNVNIYFFNNAISGNLSVFGTNSCGMGLVSENFPIMVKSCAVNPANLNIPNAFSPNGDGINDFFVIQGLTENAKLMIFDRSGKKLYESGNYLNEWDGKDNEGIVLESGTYWYILILSGIQTEFKGFVYLKK